MKNQPDWVCYDCGVKFGKHVRDGISTFHMNNCGVCGEWKSVTDPRNYGHLDMNKVNNSKPTKGQIA